MEFPGPSKSAPKSTADDPGTNLLLGGTAPGGARSSEGNPKKDADNLCGKIRDVNLRDETERRTGQTAGWATTDRSPAHPLVVMRVAARSAGVAL